MKMKFFVIVLLILSLSVFSSCQKQKTENDVTSMHKKQNETNESNDNNESEKSITEKKQKEIGHTDTEEKPQNEAEEDDIESIMKNKVDDQSFEIELNEWGKVEFISCIPDSDENKDPLTDASFYLLNLKENQIVYHFPDISKDNIRETGLYSGISFVMFTDSNGDGKEDVIIGLTYIFGAGPQGMIPYTEVRIYEDLGNEFVYNSSLCNKINGNIPSDATADDVKQLLKK